VAARRRREDDAVVEITSAPTAPGDELAGRERKYLISMAIRSACFVGGVIAIAAHVVWLGAILLVASLILPAIAVVFANSGTPRLPGSPTAPGPVDLSGHRELGPGGQG
jgi:hypothetical protein